MLAKHLPGGAGWVPNPVARSSPAPERVAAARAWLDAQLGESAPVGLLPCRLLRRKNIAEALLLTRWLRPEAWFVTTGGPSSADEQAHAAALSAARQHGWRVRLGVLQGALATHALGMDLFERDLCFWSFEHGFSKPDPHVFQILAGRLAARRIQPGDILMIGDRADNDIGPARDHGWQTWLLASDGDGHTGGPWPALRWQMAF